MILTKDTLIEQLNALFPDNNQAQITPQRLRDYFINVLDSVVVGTLPVVNNLLVNVKDYGAVGDGEADDTQAFLDALALGRNVFVPEGHFVITSALSLEPQQQLIGSGGNTYIHFNEGTYDSNYCLFLFEFAKLKDVTIVSNIILTNLRIIEVTTEGNCIENVTFKNINFGIDVNYTSGSNAPALIVENCTFTNCNKAIILKRDNQIKVAIADCKFLQNGVALELNNFNLDVKNCLFEGGLLVRLSHDNVEANPIIDFQHCVFKSTISTSAIISNLYNTSYLLNFKDCSFYNISTSAPNNNGVWVFTRCNINLLRIADDATHLAIRMIECALIDNAPLTGGTYEIELINNTSLINNDFQLN
jgi:Pectate lyase superfamily protein